MASLTMHRVRAFIYFFLVEFAAASILLQLYNPSLFNPNFFLHSKSRHNWKFGRQRLTRGQHMLQQE
jgi:hypothetical protein